jgi:Terminase small subunit.
MKKPDWEAIRRDYETDGVTARKLAEKYGISHTAINNKARKEGWKQPDKKVSTSKVSGKKVSTKKVSTGRVETRKVETRKEPESDDERESETELEESTERDVDLGFDPKEFGLTERQALFVYGCVKTKSRIGGYRFAGYNDNKKTAYVEASRLYRKPNISKAIKTLEKKIRDRYTAELDEIVDQLVAITRADPNLLTQYRRVNCRFCWGEKNLYQWRDHDEIDKAEAKASSGKGPIPDTRGGVGFVDNADPNPDCPKCQGEGRGDIKISDTRDLENDEQVFYLGVKQTKNGIEVLTESKQAARAMLIKILADKQDEDEGNMMSVMPVPTTDSVDEWEKHAQKQQDESLGK